MRGLDYIYYELPEAGSARTAGNDELPALRLQCALAEDSNPCGNHPGATDLADGSNAGAALTPVRQSAAACEQSAWRSGQQTGGVEFCRSQSHAVVGKPDEPGP